MNQTAICNLALVRLGVSQPIADITENSTPARACNAVYEQCVRTMLRERPWQFASRQVALALVGENLMSDWLFTYRYPADYIATNRVFPYLVPSAPVSIVHAVEHTYMPDYPFRIGSDAIGRLIHTDVDDAVVEGTVYIPDTSMYDPMFSSALAWFIAAEIAVSLTKNKDLYGNAFTQYQTIVSEAFATGMNEQKPRASAEANMIAARD